MMPKMLCRPALVAARATSAARPAAARSAAVPFRQRFSTSPPNTVDKELQGSYEGLFPRLMTLQMLLDKKARRTLFDLHKNGVVPQESPLIALAIFADLQNPLLKKYKFDAADFVVGAKEAFRQVHMAIASADFFNFSNGFASDQGSDALLKESLHPKLYAACREACVEMHEKNVQTHMQAIKVLATSLLRVTTHIQEEAEPSPLDDAIAHAVTNLHAHASSSSSSSSAAAAKDGTDAAATATAPASDAEASSSSSSAASQPSSSTVKGGPYTYPVGSVVATVDVAYEAEEEYESKLPDGTRLSTKRTTTTQWTFRGVVSGQTELDWKITGFNGFGFE